MAATGGVSTQLNSLFLVQLNNDAASFACKGSFIGAACTGRQQVAETAAASWCWPSVLLWVNAFTVYGLPTHCRLSLRLCCTAAMVLPPAAEEPDDWWPCYRTNWWW